MVGPGIGGRGGRSVRDKSPVALVEDGVQGFGFEGSECDSSLVLDEGEDHGGKVDERESHRELVNDVGGQILEADHRQIRFDGARTGVCLQSARGGGT